MRNPFSLTLLMMVIGLCALMGCNNDSSSSLIGSGNGSSGSGGDSKELPRIVMGKDDLELKDPNSNMDGIAAPGEEIAFSMTVRNEGDFVGVIDILDLKVVPSGSLKVVSRQVEGSSVADFNQISVPENGSTLVTGTAIVDPMISIPSVIMMGPPEIVASSPPTTPETLVNPDDITGFDTLTIEENSGGPPAPPDEGVFHLRRPGSILLFPFFRLTDLGGGAVDDTLITVTNTNPDMLPGAHGLPGGTIDLKFYYLAAPECQPFDLYERLTPNDTFSVLVGNHIPVPPAQLIEGWLYVVAVDPITHEPVDFDYLIGHAMYFNSMNARWLEYSPAAFRGVTGDGLPTDVDLDGNQDLNGIEYEMMSENQMFPRFIGRFTVPAPGFRAELLLLNLTAGPFYQSSLDFLIFNDNEQVWSTTFDFKCWTVVPLENISTVFNNDFLLGTNHDPLEQLNILGNPNVETGWFKLDGNVAWYYTKQIDDPAIICLMLEWYQNRVIAAQPFDNGLQQPNATLWPLSPLGDNED